MLLCATLALAASTVEGGACQAQRPMLSEHAVTAQTVAGTTITVEYYRPLARGRDSLFGKVVKWGDHWTPGANWATTIEVDHDVRRSGRSSSPIAGPWSCAAPGTSSTCRRPAIPPTCSSGSTCGPRAAR